ncbi:SufE family protein [Microbaculum marinisediminis]|uniref:SufE family protein n=1 Tax=Microbaculum marinisediminis TaxID=2931392 RepID=A0AAW5QT86_9HYPH|nr:SufE family protein [Microbaculum sp. A6E488]MCT8971246.1 SufE family protein [Microbaculum sp. A6E488]
MTNAAASAPIKTILDDFAFLDDWEDRYRYVIELGRTLEPLGDAERTAETKVNGCASQVWLVTEVADGDDPVLVFRGDSDAHIVRGLIAILLALYSGRPANEILATSSTEIFDKLGLRDHLSSQRSNGLKAMVARIQRDAEAATATALS